MPGFVAPPPDSDSRKAIEKRAREATQPPQPEEKAHWPFHAADTFVCQPDVAAEKDKPAPKKKPKPAA